MIVVSANVQGKMEWLAILNIAIQFALIFNFYRTISYSSLFLNNLLKSVMIIKMVHSILLIFDIYVFKFDGIMCLVMLSIAAPYLVGYIEHI